MNILYLGYWNLGDPLTMATVFPNLSILQNFDGVGKIVFCNVERKIKTPVFQPGFSSSKIAYHPLLSGRTGIGILDKLLDFAIFPVRLATLTKEYGVDIVIARGALAGSLAYLLWKKNKTAFIVESFEPHADYMVESGVWNKRGLQYLVQKRWEQRQKKHAYGLIPVAYSYKCRLIHEGVLEKQIAVAPCFVDFSKFVRKEKHIAALRRAKKLPEASTIGIYAGKYGGLYLEEESFQLYVHAFRFFQDFHLILLTPVEFHEWIYRQVEYNKLPIHKITVMAVPHHEVPEYLTISDFAFATYKPGLCKAYLSPVKIGEYWACGLPVVLTKGVGDESQFIDEKIGVLFDAEHINDQECSDMYQRLLVVLNSPSVRSDTVAAAKKHRHQDATINAYKFFLSS